MQDLSKLNNTEVTLVLNKEREENLDREEKRRMEKTSSSQSQNLSTAPSECLAAPEAGVGVTGHSPLPWRVAAPCGYADKSAESHFDIEDADEMSIALTIGDLVEDVAANNAIRELANAELIVKAVNSYAVLVAALKLYVDHFGDPLKVARAALALAEGQDTIEENKK